MNSPRSLSSTFSLVYFWCVAVPNARAYTRMSSPLHTLFVRAAELRSLCTGNRSETTYTCCNRSDLCVWDATWAGRGCANHISVEYYHCKNTSCSSAQACIEGLILLGVLAGGSDATCGPSSFQGPCHVSLRTLHLKPFSCIQTQPVPSVRGSISLPIALLQRFINMDKRNLASLR